MSPKTMQLPELNIVFQLAKIMKDPLQVKSISMDSSNKDAEAPNYPVWGDLCLSNGLPSLILFYNELHQQFPDRGWDHIAHNYIQKVGEAIEITGLQNFSLFAGLAGICFAISLASQQGKRYKNLLTQLHEFLINSIEKYYLCPLENDIKKGIPSSPFFYDLIQGIVGIGVHFLANCDEPTLFPVLIKLIRLLIGRTQSIKFQGIEVPGWYIPVEYQLTPQDKEEYPSGNFNLGLAHGIPSILAFLSIASVKGIKLPGQQEAISKIVHWIKDQAVWKGDFLLWPSRIAWKDKDQSPALELSQRMGWCYGKPGILRSLYLAGLALKDQQLQEYSHYHFKQIFKISSENWQLRSPTFCHGLLGLYTITKHMAKDTQDPNLQNEGVRMKQCLINFYSDSYPFGYQDLEYASIKTTGEQKLLQMNKPGLLDGSVGIALALLDSVYPAKSHWEAPFLISNPG